MGTGYRPYDEFRISSGSRVRPDGVRLSWRLTDPIRRRFDGIAPFFIDWGTSPHPAADLPQRCALIGLRAEHPEAEKVQAALAGL
ncbi:MAG TPA: VOC family protein, partial [Acidobacteriota bacterium]